MFSKDAARRFVAVRSWREGPVLAVVLANPTPLGPNDNPTVRACMAIACRHGFGSIRVVNVDARLSVTPLPDVVEDAENEAHVRAAVAASHAVWVAWGTAAQAPSWVVDALRGGEVWSLGRSRSGAPLHPARKAYASTLVREPVVESLGGFDGAR